jgi:hypothetical protein
MAAVMEEVAMARAAEGLVTEAVVTAAVLVEESAEAVTGRMQSPSGHLAAYT